ncbi:MAG: hypothetical protein R2739_05350 [Chitinophagales bacterium]|nr:hypothetical protein [Bacteroidota bacterium]
MKNTMNQFKNKRSVFFILTLFISLALSSCKKDGIESDGVPLIVPSDADGYLFASRATIQGETDPSFIGSAAFSNTPGVTANFVNVGTVKCNDATCNNISNVYSSYFANFTSGNLKWEISGGNGFGAFTKSGLTFPSIPVITSGTNVTKSGFTVTNNAVTGADKLLYTIGSTAIPSKLKLKWASSTSATSMTFSASDLSDFTVGESVGIIVNAYKVSSETLGGKNIYIRIWSQYLQEGTIH